MAGWKQNDKSSKKEELQKNSSSFSYIHIIIIFQVPLPQLAFFSDGLSLVFLLVPLLPLFLASLLVLVPLPFSDDLSLASQLVLLLQLPFILFLIWQAFLLSLLPL